MKIEWIEKHSIEISEARLREIAKDMDDYAIPFGWNLMEHCLDEWMHDSSTLETIVDFDKIVMKMTEIVKEYKKKES